jgi:alkanesulfonate monooxygenase SsuD/methylene tetrahydromethanopterin reductase-like flavin-dependent oxidoreductase (luciferase family)
VIRGCFDQDEFSFSGKYWNFERLRMTPKPVQEHLPIWVAANLPRAIEEAGRNGYHLAAAPPKALQDVYDENLRKAGFDPSQFERAGLHIGHLATTHEKAWDECEAHLQWHMKIHFQAMAAPENRIMNRGMDLTVPELGELRRRGMGPYGPAYVGTPDEVVKMLEEELKVCPMTEIVFSIDSPGMDPRYMKSSMELFAKEVIPHFRKR